MTTIDQPTPAPTNKTTAAGAAGAAAAVLAWLAQTFTSVEVPPGIEAAFAVLIATAAAYFVREKTITMEP